MSEVKKLLRRVAASEYLETEHGIRCAPKTLSKLASVGGGPKFHKFRLHVYYFPSELDSWVEENLSAPLSSTAAYAADEHIHAVQNDTNT